MRPSTNSMSEERRLRRTDSSSLPLPPVSKRPLPFQPEDFVSDSSDSYSMSGMDSDDGELSLLSLSLQILRMLTSLPLISLADLPPAKRKRLGELFYLFNPLHRCSLTGLSQDRGNSPPAKNFVRRVLTRARFPPFSVQKTSPWTQ